jgi:hypothetical protein
MIKAFRFGVVTGGHASGSAWITLAQRVEELGYATLLLPDVLGTPLAAMTAIAVAATATTKLRVGSYVFVNDYRNPALFAREIATLDQLSDGRVEIGLGAGNWPHEYQQLGLPFIELTDGPIATAPPFPGMPVETRPMAVEQAVEYLLEQREHLGISYIQVQERQLENFAPVVARLNGK